MFDYCFILHWVTELSSRLELKLYRLKTEYLTRVSRYSLRRELSLSSILNNRDISITTINSVGNSLKSAIRKSHIIFTIGQITISCFLGSKVIVSVVILYCILIGIESWFSWVRIYIRCSLVGRSRLIYNRGRLVYNRGWSRLIQNRGRLICYRGRLVNNRSRFIDNWSRSVDNWSWPIRGRIVQMVYKWCRGRGYNSVSDRSSGRGRCGCSCNCGCRSSSCGRCNIWSYRCRFNIRSCCSRGVTITVIRLSLSSKRSKPRDKSFSNCLLESSPSEYRYTVTGLAELKQNGKVVILLGSSSGNSYQDGETHELGTHVELYTVLRLLPC